MKIEFGSRATGKTVRMLRELDGREDAILLCLNTRICHIMKDTAKRLGVNLVNEPISYENKRDGIRMKGKKVYVDDGRMFLEKMLSDYEVEKVNFTVEIK